MDTTQIVEQLNSEIERLTQARDLLLDDGAFAMSKAGRRPGYKLTAAARKKMSDAAKKRWKDQKSK